MARTSTARRRRVIAVVAAVVVLGGAGVGAVALTTAADRPTVEGRTSAPPWSAPEDVEARAAAAGLPLLKKEGQVLHLHEHLSITIDGRPVRVPALLGIDEAAKRTAAIHTHDTTGVIHVESPVRRTFHLGQVFTEWDVALGTGRIGGYRDGRDGARVAVWVDRTRYAGDPAGIVLGRRQDIDVVATTDGSAPRTPTTAYPFPSNY